MLEEWKRSSTLPTVGILPGSRTTPWAINLAFMPANMSRTNVVEVKARALEFVFVAITRNTIARSTEAKPDLFQSPATQAVQVSESALEGSRRNSPARIHVFGQDE